MKSKEAFLLGTALFGATSLGIILEKEYKVSDSALNSRDQAIEYVSKRLAQPTPTTIPTRTIYVEKKPTAIPTSTPIRVPSIRQEFEGWKPLAFAAFATEKPDLVSQKNQLNIGVNTSDLFPVYGYGKNPYTFLVGGIDGIQYEVPIEQMLVVSGSPIKDIKKNLKLGIRNQTPEYMLEAARLGVGSVRIAGNNEQFSDKNIEKSLTLARENGLKVLYVLNPSKTVKENDLVRTVRFVKIFGKDLTWEIGNEMDNKEYPFWEESEENFYKYAKTAISVIEKEAPNSKIVMGALVDIDRSKAYIENLQFHGIDTSKLIFSVHAYGTCEDIEKRVKVLRQVNPGGTIWMTELGIQGESKKEIVKLLDKAFGLGVESVFVHELVGEQGFECIDQLTKKINSQYYFIQNWVQNNPS